MFNLRKKRNYFLIATVFIVCSIFIYVKFDYNGYNEGMLQIVDKDGEHPVIEIYNENELLTTIEDFELYDIEKSGNMVYYLGSPGIYYQSLTNINEVSGVTTIADGGTTTLLERGYGDEVFFVIEDSTLDGHKANLLCSSTLKIENVNCIDTETDRVQEIVYDESSLYLIAIDESEDTDKIILKKYNHELEKTKDLEIGDLEGQVGMLDSQYIFDINDNGLYVYEEGKDVITYDLPAYKFNSDEMQIEDEFSYNGDYYFVSSENLVKIDDKSFAQPTIETVFDQYLYRDYYNIYFIRNNEVIKHNLTSKQTTKTAIKNRGKKNETNYYINKL